ncbi:hypothetical protein [Rubritepida flocculans]|uniref:hypothetical protein n=1 Tax=Rubritepida flocculans TaxID=182403 RepID=UPI000421E785|nr:hypothetical protein [Rubritepida flocculans]
MPFPIRTIALAATAVMALAQPAPAAAQGLPSYCNNTLYTNSLYANVRSDGRTANVEYHGQFQNRDPQGRRITASMATVTHVTINNIQFTVVRHIGTFTLDGWQQRDIQFLTLRVNNPSGQGAPSAVDVGRTVRFTCSFG